MDRAKQEVSPQILIAAVVVLVLIVGGLWWKFVGPGSASSIPVKPPQYRDPTTGQMRFGSPAEPPGLPSSGASGGR